MPPLFIYCKESALCHNSSEQQPVLQFPFCNYPFINQLLFNVGTAVVGKAVILCPHWNRMTCAIYYCNVNSISKVMVSAASGRICNKVLHICPFYTVPHILLYAYRTCCIIYYKIKVGTDALQQFVCLYKFFSSLREHECFLHIFI